MPQALEELTLLHTRSYDTKVYRDGEHLKVAGSVQDVKPPGMYIADDPDPLEIHHMTVVLTVAIADLRITDAEVEFRTHPNASCPSIVEHYDQLVGLSIARGFNRKVRELFGGPRACTHTTALLQAMAPVVVQAMWSVRMDQRRESGANPFAANDDMTSSFEANLNTCHVWVEGGELIERARAGEVPEVPIWIHAASPNWVGIHPSGETALDDAIEPPAGLVPPWTGGWPRRHSVRSTGIDRRTELAQSHGDVASCLYRRVAVRRRWRH